METLAIAAFIAAAIPAAMTLVNLGYFRPLPRHAPALEAVSVLIPARDEERSIEAAVRSVIASRGVTLELIVLDDGSTDRTAAIVGTVAKVDERVRLARGTPLPSGWCGKQFACRSLARLAKYDRLLFLDADVRLSPDAVARLLAFQDATQADLVSIFPRQETGTWLEQLLIPQIHFLLLGFLPMPLGRLLWRWPSFAAGCGQVFMARRPAYESIDGHAAIKESRHDGLTLPRAFRKAGFRTGIADGTDTATCRMYQSASEVWFGLAKNAREGLAQMPTLLVFTLWLLLGAVLPPVLLVSALVSGLGGEVVAVSAGATVLAYLPRLVGRWRFRQAPRGVIAHPAGVLALLLLQWYSLARGWLGRPVGWKGRPQPHT